MKMMNLMSLSLLNTNTESFQTFWTYFCADYSMDDVDMVFDHLEQPIDCIYLIIFCNAFMMQKSEWW